MISGLFSILFMIKGYSNLNGYFTLISTEDKTTVLQSMTNKPTDQSTNPHTTYKIYNIMHIRGHP